MWTIEDSTSILDQARSFVVSEDSKIFIGSFIFFGLVVISFAARYALAGCIARTPWFIDRSVRFALWAAAWACIVTLLDSTVGLTHGSLPSVALGPIILITTSLFVLVLLKIPVVWLSTVIDVLARFKKRD
ncbi:hypothetical protein [Methylobacterium nonmethylotrophicum]|uniref:Uncharacterized protein n=1 Tax=Methylobacterium nonmethylotrophicum TaxID=1141884 RepID=A0A4Z0NFE6_9HYPH|nr:hypothetical protein [Methylobacterium nonmethylotrophicum]TGD95026.1 hypothetical protein EU555_29710 [Methylobacterium nonmethylotrophicum]